MCGVIKFLRSSSSRFVSLTNTPIPWLRPRDSSRKKEAIQGILLNSEVFMRTCILLALLACGSVSGCAEEQRPTPKQKQDAVLRDPWNYSPFDDRTDVSGGGISDFKKDAFKKDVNSVFSP